MIRMTKEEAHEIDERNERSDCSVCRIFRVIRVLRGQKLSVNYKEEPANNANAREWTMSRCSPPKAGYKSKELASCHARNASLSPARNASDAGGDARQGLASSRFY